MTKHKIVLVPFPFDDLTGNKVRPAVCLTDPIGPHRHVVVAFITSRIPPELLASDFVIRMDGDGFVTTGLRVSSTIRLHRLMTLTTGMMVRELGQIPESMAADVEERLRHLFGL